MSTPIVTVLSVSGQAWARDADGNLRPLEPGDVLLEGEVLITSDNGRVQLDFGDAEPVAIGPGQTVTMLAELNADNPVPDDEATAADENIEALLAAIEEGEGDLLEVLDPTAAGVGGGDAGGGHSFVRLARINENVDPLAFDFGPPQLDGLVQADGETLGLLDEDEDDAVVNNAPVAVDDSNRGDEDTAISGNVLTNDSDVDGDALAVTGFRVGDTSYVAGETAELNDIGTLVIESDGSYTFTPVENYNGPVPVAEYTISDGELTDTATLELTVDPVNDAPVAVDDSNRGDEDTTISGNVLSNDSDVDGDTLTVTNFTVNQTTYQAGETATLDDIGTLTIGADGDYTFTPVENWNGQVPSVSYTITDGELTDTATLDLTIDPVNDAPIAVDDSNRGDEDTPINGNVLTNDSDVDGDTLTVVGFTVDNTTYDAGETATLDDIGTLIIDSDGSYTFTPVENWNGQVPAVTYTITDGELSDTATLNLTVDPVNDAPVGNDDNATSAADDALTTPEDTPLIIVPQTLLANDNDVDGDELFISAIDDEARDGDNNIVGTVTTASDNDGRVTQITFTPNADYNGDAIFDYTVSDGTATDTATVTVDVTPVNDPPVAVDDSNSVDAGDSVTATGGQDGEGVLGNDSDIDGDPIQVSQVDGSALVDGSISVDGRYGTLDIDSSGGYTYTSNLSTPVLYGFNDSDTNLDGNLDSFELNVEAQQRVSSTEDGVGVTGSAQNHPVPDQINEIGDVLIADLGVSVSSATFGVARLFNDESGGESGKWYAYDASGNLVGSGEFGPNSVDYRDGSNNIGTVTISAEDVDGDFQFLAFESLDYQFGETNSTNDGGDYFVTGITVQDDFDYTIVDGQGGEAGATLTVDSSASLIGYQPDLTVEPSSATVSEEGLAGGIPDDNGSRDTTDAIVSNGTIAITDLDSPDLTVTLSEPTTDLTSNGEDVTWSVDDEGQTLVGTAGDHDVIKVTIDDQGEYEVELLGPVDHPDSDSEDVLALEIGVNASDGVDQASTSLTVTIEDDSPVANSVSDTVAAPGANTNVLLVLDTSSSMGEDSGVDGLTRLEVMQNSVSMLLDQYGALGDVKVQLAIFNDDVENPASAWVDIDDAKTIVNELVAGGGTNYDYALFGDADEQGGAINAFEADGKIEGANNVSYFLSDGDPTLSRENPEPGGDQSPHRADLDQSDGIGSTEQQAWQDFLDANGIDSYAIGMGTGADEQYLEPIGHDGSPDAGDDDDPRTIVVEDFNDLPAVVSSTAAGTPYEGSLVTGLVGQGANFGADGAGYIKSVTVGDITYTYGPDSQQIVETEGGRTHAHASGSGVLTATTALGSTLVLNMQDGNYTYTPNSNQTGTDNIGYTTVDADGDSSSSTFTFEVREPIRLQAESSELTSDLGLHGEYYGYNDDRVGSEDGKDYHGKIRLHADDGSATQDGGRNLDTIDEVATIIEGRAGGILGTGQHADEDATDAEFVATNVNYNINEGSGFGENLDLGDNPMDKPGHDAKRGNLYDFLEHGGDEDSLEVTSGLGQTTDAIIRLSGSVYLEGGTYDIRVTGDDGFRLTIAGNEVASFNEITAPIATTEEDVHLAEGFQDIELLYWDQAERALLKVELKKSGDDDSEYQVLSTDNFALFGEDPRPDLEENQTLVRDEDGSFSILTGVDYTGGDDADVVVGSQANDTIDGGAGNDILRGAGGSDTLTGGLGADTFVWHLGDEDTAGTPAIDTSAIDTVTDFDADEGDKLDLSDLLQNRGEEDGIADYLSASDDGEGGTVLHISTTGELGGGHAGADQTINLEGVGMGNKSSTEFVEDMVSKGQIDI